MTSGDHRNLLSPDLVSCIIFKSLFYHFLFSFRISVVICLAFKLYNFVLCMSDYVFVTREDIFNVVLSLTEIALYAE